MSTSAAVPSLMDVMKSPEFTGAEVLDQRAFHIRTVIKSGKHGKVALCEHGDEDEVAIKSELIKSPNNPFSRPYREYFILKQLSVLAQKNEYYENPRWIGFIQLLDWFKAKTDQIRITSTPASPIKTPTRLTGTGNSRNNSSPTNLGQRVPFAPVGSKTAPRSVTAVSRLNFGDGQENLDDMRGSFSNLQLTPSGKRSRVSSTPTPKRTIARAPLLQKQLESNSSPLRQREIKLQEGNLVLEKADTTLYAIRSDLSFNIFRDVLFQILYALYVGQTEFEFVHHDLHIQNVLLKKLKVNIAEYMGEEISSPSRSKNDTMRDMIDEERMVEENVGVFKLGEKIWYSRGPWMAKLSDFGLSRIRMVDGDGGVVYDLTQPLAEAFLGDKDVLKILDEFSRSKITRWLTKNECIECGAIVRGVRAECFVGPEKAISFEQIQTVLQPQAAIEKMSRLIEAKQKAVRSIRSSIRKNALHLKSLLHHEFFEALQTKPTSLWLFDRQSNDNNDLLDDETGTNRSPSILRDAVDDIQSEILNDDDFSADEDLAPLSLPVKKLTFEEAIKEEPVGPIKTPRKGKKENNMENSKSKTSETGEKLEKSDTTSEIKIGEIPTNGEIEEVDVCSVTPPHSPEEMTPISRRSARVAARSSKTPSATTPTRKLVKPDSVALARAASSPVAEDATKYANRAKTPTPVKIKTSKSSTTSGKRPARRETILPSQFEASSENIETVHRSLERLSITPLTFDEVGTSKHVHWSQKEEKQIFSELTNNFGPVPSRCLDVLPPLPMQNHAPLNWIEAVRDYLVRQAQKWEDTRHKRKKFRIDRFFVRNAVEVEEARVEASAARLAKRRRHQKVISRRSMGGRSQLEKAVNSSQKSRRKSMSAVSDAPKLDVLQEEVTQSVIETVLDAVSVAVGEEAKMEKEYPTIVDQIALSRSEMSEKMDSEKEFKPVPRITSSCLDANGLGMLTSPTAPRRSLRRRASLVASPLSTPVPLFSLSASNTTALNSNSGTPATKIEEKSIAKISSRSQSSQASSKRVSSKSTANNTSQRPPTPIKTRTPTSNSVRATSSSSASSSPSSSSPQRQSASKPASSIRSLRI